MVSPGDNFKHQSIATLLQRMSSASLLDPIKLSIPVTLSDRQAEQHLDSLHLPLSLHLALRTLSNIKEYKQTHRGILC